MQKHLVCLQPIFEFPIDIHVYMFRHVIEAIDMNWYLLDRGIFQLVWQDTLNALYCITDVTLHLMKGYTLFCIYKKQNYAYTFSNLQETGE